VTVGAISGHSLGGIGALVAAAADPRVAAVAATSAAADPDRLTRQTFRLARLPIPDPVAYPLAWLTTRVFLRPRGHRVGAVSATAAIRRYRGPVLLAHGDEDVVMPISHLGRLAAARGPRWSDPTRPATELISLAVPGGQHSWLYEFAEYRRAMAEFFSRALGGPHEPRLAGEIAAATPAWRIPDGEGPFTAVEAEPGGFRSLAGIIGPGVRPVEADASG
jgi:pimeloyl-ACP methyl ester carboxylesterase